MDELTTLLQGLQTDKDEVATRDADLATKQAARDAALIAAESAQHDAGAARDHLEVDVETFINKIKTQFAVAPLAA